MPDFRGIPCCSCQAAWLPVLQAEAIRLGFIKVSLDIYQLIGGAAASGGTHSRGGAADMKQAQDGFIRLCRQMGAPGTWPRAKNWDNRGGIAHNHSVLFGCPHNRDTALYQIISRAFGVFFAKNGLANGGPDPVRFRPWVSKTRTWSQGIKWAADQIPTTKVAKKWTVTKASTAARVYPGVGPVKTSRARGYKLTTVSTYRGKDGVLFARTRWGAWYDTRDLESTDAVTVALRPAHYNLPAADKLPNPEKRLDAAVELIARAAPTVVGFNELEPIRSASQGSAFAGQLDARLPGEYRWVKPTLAFNENYLAYRHDLVEVLDFEDVIVPGGTTGRRHLTMGKFRERTTGFEFVQCVGQLVQTPGGSSDAVKSLRERDRQTGAAQALRSAREFANGMPLIISFDANTPNLLKALADAGMKQTRRFADTSDSRDDATYTRIDKDAPDDSIPAWIGIDQTYVDPVFYVVGYSVLRALTAAGKYLLPRPSDHDLTVNSVRATHTPKK